MKFILQYFKDFYKFHSDKTNVDDYRFWYFILLELPIIILIILLMYIEVKGGF